MYSGICDIGPGRYKATITIKSSTRVGLSSFKYLVIPLPESWKTPIVSPRESISKVFLSLRGIPAIFIGSFLFSLTIEMAEPKVAKFRSPKRSNFRRPTASPGETFGSSASMSYWVIIFFPSGSSWTGVKFLISSGAITTPAAWTEICLALPSTWIAKSRIFFFLRLISSRKSVIAFSSCFFVLTITSEKSFTNLFLNSSKLS